MAPVGCSHEAEGLLGALRELAAGGQSGAAFRVLRAGLEATAGGKTPAKDELLLLATRGGFDPTTELQVAGHAGLVLTGRCVHLGRRTAVFSARYEGEDAVLRLHISGPPSANEAAGMRALHPAHAPGVLQAVTLAGVPGLVCTHITATTLADLHDITTGTDFLPVINAVLALFAAVEAAGVSNPEMTAADVAVTPPPSVNACVYGWRAASASPAPRQAFENLKGCIAALRTISSTAPTLTKSAVATLTAKLAEKGAPTTVEGVRRLWDNFRWSPEEDLLAEQRSPNRITRRIQHAQEAALVASHGSGKLNTSGPLPPLSPVSPVSPSDKQADTELQLLKKRLSTSQGSTKLQPLVTTPSESWLRRQQEEEEARRAEFLKDIERKESVSRLRQVLRQHRKLSYGEEDLRGDGCLADSTPLNESWTRRQAAVEEERRQQFIKEIETEEEVKKLKERLKASSSSPPSSSEPLPSDALQNFLDRQAREEEQRRQAFLQEIEEVAKLRQVLKNSASRSRYHPEPNGLCNGTAEGQEWLEKQRGEEESRRAEFLAEIERKEEVGKLQAALRRGRKESYEALDQPLADIPIDEGWQRRQSQEEEARRQAFLKEIAEKETK